MSNSGPTDNGHSPSLRSGSDMARALEALLEFYSAAGVDGLMEPEPVDAFAAPAIPARTALEPQLPEASPGTTGGSGKALKPADVNSTASGSIRRQPGSASLSPATTQQAVPPAKAAGTVTASAVIPGEEAVAAAREIAQKARSLEELRQSLASFDGCNLRISARNLVFGDGDPRARLMFVGEQPDKDEDQAGKPLAGRPGELFDRILAAVGLDRQSVYAANVIPWRPPGGRTPSPQEVEICRPFITRQIELVEPQILVFLGGASAEILTGVSEGILRFRGRWMPLPVLGREIRAIATLPPAHLLRQPAHKGLAWRDFLEISAALAKT